MKNFNLDNLERKNIYKIPENMFENIQEKVLSGVKSFDVESLERKNVYKTPENLFVNIQEKVWRKINGVDLDTLERKNIYQIREHLFETVQDRVLNEIKTEKKTPIFKLNWGYAVAASLALVFGMTFIFNSDSDSSEDINSVKNYTKNVEVPKKESQIAYETLASDLTSVDDANQTTENQKNVKSFVSQRVNPKVENKSKEADVKTNKIQMNEYIEALTSSEIAELANNSSQDVYLDLYN